MQKVKELIFSRSRYCAKHYKFHSCLRISHGLYSLKFFLKLWEAALTLASTLLPFKKAISGRRYCVSSYEFNSMLSLKSILNVASPACAHRASLQVSKLAVASVQDPIYYKIDSCLRTFHGGCGLKVFLMLWEASPTLESMPLPLKKAVSARRYCASSY